MGSKKKQTSSGRRRLSRHLWIAAAAVSLLPSTSSESEPRKNLREEEYYREADSIHLGQRGNHGRSRREEHEERLLAQAGKKLWSRRRADGGPEFPIVPSFGLSASSQIHQSDSQKDNNPRSRNLSVGVDSFHMIGNSIANDHPDYGIGNGGSTRQTPTSAQLPNYEHPRNNNGKSTKSTKAGASGKGGSGSGSRPTRPPSHPGQPIRPPSSVQPPSFFPHTGGGGGSCHDPITMQFLQFSAIPPAILVFPEDPNVQDLGTRYIYNNDLRDSQTMDELTGSKSNGVCTRTQARIQEVSGAVYQLGGGHCQFTYTFNDGSRTLTLETSGAVVDSMGGTLSITGGTQDAIGAYGEITLTPVNLTPDGEFERATGDFFLDPLFYLADAVVFTSC